MVATIQLRKGDMFAQPADLIIIPCSTGATITQRVAERLETFDIEPPHKIMNLGDVEFSLFVRASSIATYVGYAASVRAMESDAKAIKQIAERIAVFVKDKPEIRDVSLPLLGSGAGKLTPEQSANALVAGLTKVSAENKVYNIFVYNDDDYRFLTRHKSSQARPKPPTMTRGRESQSSHSGPTAPIREPIRVFISYTRTNGEHQDWVRDTAVFLRANGIDARLDIWHLRPGMDLPQWMCNELDMADRVLIICNEDYALRADGRIGGVGWEIRLVQADLLQTQSSNPKKFIPIIRSGAVHDGVPKFLQGTYCIRCKDGEETRVRDNLLRELYEAYEEAPPIGTPPRYVLR
jgi:hypothetical protein